MQQMPRLDLTPELHKKYTEGLESGGQELIAISVNLVAMWGSDCPSPAHLCNLACPMIEFYL